jgi:hypothetical protein
MTQSPAAQVERDDELAHKSPAKPKPTKRKIKHKADDGQQPEAFDSLVPDAIARAELGGVSKMTWWRWQRDVRMIELGFPVAVTICDRTYRSRAELEAFKARLMREAIKERSKLQKRGPKPQKDGARS